MVEHNPCKFDFFEKVEKYFHQIVYKYTNTFWSNLYIYAINVDQIYNYQIIIDHMHVQSTENVWITNLYVNFNDCLQTETPNWLDMKPTRWNRGFGDLKGISFNQ